MMTVINPPANKVYHEHSVMTLDGFDLDLAVANTLNIAVTTNLPTGYTPQSNVLYYTIGSDGLAKEPFAPSSLWEQAGPYIFTYCISIVDKGNKWGAMIRIGELVISIHGKNPLNAAMRALVASTYGTVILM